MTDSASSETSRASGIHDRTYGWHELYGIRHIALIPDGNRRWAKNRSLPAELGHAHSLTQVMPVLLNRLCEAGVHTLTVWGFSTENWTRQPVEVGALMSMAAQFMRNQLLEISQRHEARVCHLGRKDRLTVDAREALHDVCEATKNNRRHIVNLALDYGGLDEMARASERYLAAMQAASAGGSSDLRITDFLDTHGQPYPEPDIVIRSSGEYRMSGFLPMQTVYSELFFVERLFPEMTFEDIQEVAEQFRWRKRRFGS